MRQLQPGSRGPPLRDPVDENADDPDNNGEDKTVEEAPTTSIDDTEKTLINVK